MIEDFAKVADVPDELVSSYEGLLPEEILDIWREHGLGTFYHEAHAASRKGATEHEV